MAKITFFVCFCFLSFLYPPHQVKQIHKSYCTEVLQSANIMNWHKLVYTHFNFRMTKKNQEAVFFSLFFSPLSLSSRAPFLFFSNVAQASRTPSTLHCPPTSSPSCARAVLSLSHQQEVGCLVFLPPSPQEPRCGREKKKGRKPESNLNQKIPERESHVLRFSKSCTTCTTSHILIGFIALRSPLIYW